MLTSVQAEVRNLRNARGLHCICQLNNCCTNRNVLLLQLVSVYLSAGSAMETVAEKD